MRRLLYFVLCCAIAAPGAALAQDIPDLAQPPAPSPDTPPPPVLTPLPTVQPTEPAPPPATAPPPPTAEPGPPAPKLSTPTTVAPVIVEKEDKDNGVADKVGAVAVGVAGGAAGAAVAGPVGKFAGGLVGKQIAKGLFGDKKDETPELTVVPRTPAAETAGVPATDQPPADPPPPKAASDDR